MCVQLTEEQPQHVLRLLSSHSCQSRTKEQQPPLLRPTCLQRSTCHTVRRGRSWTPLLALPALLMLSLSFGRMETLAECVLAEGGQGTEFCSPSSFDLTSSLPSALLSAGSSFKDGEPNCELEGGEVKCEPATDGQFDVQHLAAAPGSWQSEIQMTADSTVNVELALPSRYILFTIRISLTLLPDKFLVQTSGDGGSTWTTRFRFTQSASECESLPNPQEKARCGAYNAEAASVGIFAETELTQLLGNTRNVQTQLDIPGGPFVNRVRIQFLKIDDMFSVIGDRSDLPKLLYYRADQLQVFGTCWCNGHARRCLMDGSASDASTCECLGNTTGPNCQECAPGFFKRTLPGGFTCQACGCSTSAGADGLACSPMGMCTCRLGYRGQRCENCSSGYHRDVVGQCVRCNCGLGVVNQECEGRTGACKCRVGVTGLKCDTCIAGHYGLSEDDGCRPCACHADGSSGRESCNQTTGQCVCALNVIGRQCDSCASGYHTLTSAGCSPLSQPSTSMSQGMPQEPTSTTSTTQAVTSRAQPVANSNGDGNPDEVLEDDSSDNTLLLIYVFIPATVAFVVLVFVIVYIIRRGRNHGDEHHDGEKKKVHLNRNDSSSSRVPLSAYAASGPRTSPDSSGGRLGQRKMSIASLYDTADVIAPQLRTHDRSRTPSAPGSKRQSFINDDRTIVATPNILHEQLMPYQTDESLTAYDISKIVNPPPEPYAKTKFKMLSIGTQPSATEESPTDVSRAQRALAEPYASAGMKLTPIKTHAAEPALPAPLNQYTLPDIEVKRQRRGIKRQKSTPTSEVGMVVSPGSPHASTVVYQLDSGQVGRLCSDV
eukprot:scpid10314/ scgid5305/ Laminin subunit beta-3; Epiligrin subunit bata; Kalinin B1 chain; Kalinin subunit beta; Laminin B1k chain; Laminin-5 subunit beta; Nicein subunit beta